MHVDCTDSIHLLCSSVEPGVVGVRDWVTGIHFVVGVGGVQARCLCWFTGHGQHTTSCSDFVTI